MAGLTRRVDRVLLGFLRDAGELVEPEARPLLDEIVELVKAGGKRIRPRFCHAGHLAAGGEESGGLLAACASLELLHTFAIIHDDLMDSSASRRGRPTAHVRLGREFAVLAGDLAMVLADRLLSRCGCAPERLAVATDLYDRMRLEAISGQYLDVRLTAPATAGPDEARRIGSLKTGSYTVRYPLLIGCALAGGDAAAAAALDVYGRAVGEGYQIRDDILGVFGDPASTGKPATTDLEQGKPTVLLAMARQLASPADLERLTQIVGVHPIEPGQAAEVRAIFTRSGALAASEGLLASLRARAADAVSDVPAPAREALADLAAEALDRSS